MNKKIITIILIVLSLIILDTIQAQAFNNTPFIKITEDYNGGSIYQKHKGILINTYICTNGTKKTIPKWQKYNCPITKDIDTTYEELNNINNQIIKYFTSPNPEYTNFSFNYIDEENQVIIVGLINNSKEEQTKFKKLVINSNLIKFVQGKKNTNY